jgi:SAM-dependent methyltransferase
MSDGRRYSIGDGRERPEGWITVDADPRVKPDIVADLPPVLPEMDGAEAFRLIHVLEHVHKWEAEEMLRGFFRALRPGGRLVLELPNLDSAIETLSGNNGRPLDRWGMWVLYGDPNHKNPLFGHKWGWTPRTLRETLVACGFSNDRIVDERAKYHVPDRDFRLVALK